MNTRPGVEKEALLELIKKAPEAVVKLLLDLMERVRNPWSNNWPKNSRNRSKPSSSDNYPEPMPMYRAEDPFEKPLAAFPVQRASYLSGNPSQARL